MRENEFNDSLLKKLKMRLKSDKIFDFKIDSKNIVP